MCFMKNYNHECHSKKYVQAQPPSSKRQLSELYLASLPGTHRDTLVLTKWTKMMKDDNKISSALVTPNFARLRLSYL